MKSGALIYIDENGVENQLLIENTADMVKYDNNGTDTTVADFLSNISANTAEFADVAEKAEKDSAGNVISTTYAPTDSPNFTGTPTAPTVTDLDLDNDQLATVDYVVNQMKKLTGVVPSELDTFEELYNAMGQDSDLSTTIATQIAAKQDSDTTLTAISNLNLTADQTLYTTGNKIFGVTDFKAGGREILTKATAREIRKALGIYRELFIDDVEVNRWFKMGEPTISNANAKFNHAAQFNNNQGIYTDPRLTFGGADFTIDMWCYMASDAPKYGIFLHCLSSGSSSTPYLNSIMLGRNSSTDALAVDVRDASGNTLLDNTFQTPSPAVPMLGTFRHYEIDYKFDTQTFYLFADGDLKYSKSGVNIPRVARYVILGCYFGDRSLSLIGAISEFRLLDGKCEHISNFTPPTEKYVADEYTLSLMHFD